MTELSDYQREILKKSSPDAVESYIADIKENFESQKRLGNEKNWLLSNNIYTTNCVQQIKTDIGNNKNLSCNNQLGEYIAISSLLHCVDGWSYLGRALECHSRGDIHNSIHLAYYAELRAAMSILAVQGIGIFDRQHFVIDQDKKCLLIANPTEHNSHGTHEIVWLAFKFWSEQKDARDLLMEIIHPFNYPLKEWFSAIQKVERTNEDPILGKFLRDWGMDLDFFIDDKKMRNELSYRPTKIKNLVEYNFEKNLNFLSNFWRFFEPSEINRFENLDRYLILYTINSIFNRSEIDIFDDDIDEVMNFETKINSLLNAMNIEGIKSQNLSKFLCNFDPQASNIISESTKKGYTFSHKIEHAPIISRAALLLRVSTGLCSRLLENTGISKDELAFWWNPLGVERGLWKLGEEPDEFTDLWADIESAIEETKKWNCENHEEQSCLMNLINSHSQYLMRLGECERIALWGLKLEEI